MKQTYPLGLLLAFSAAAGVPAAPLAQRPAVATSVQFGVTGMQTSPPTKGVTTQASPPTKGVTTQAPPPTTGVTTQASPPTKGVTTQTPPPTASAPRQPGSASNGSGNDSESSQEDSASLARLDMTLSERQYFQFGYTLAHSAFAYAELTKRSAPISRLHSKLEQIHQLAALAPLARNKRAEVHEQLASALDTMHNLNAPPAATALIQKQEEEYGRPPILHGDAKQLADFDPDAGQALAALDEFETTSGIPENPALHDWLTAPSTAASGRVWYAEGLIAGIAQIASQQQMPELLPPLADITTDLRGLRDWIATRTPDHPSPTLLTLKSNLDAFLQQTGRNHPIHRAVTPAELTALGDVSQQLAVEILGPQSQTQSASEVKNVAVVPATPGARLPENPAPTTPGIASNAHTTETPQETPEKP